MQITLSSGVENAAMKYQWLVDVLIQAMSEASRNAPDVNSQRWELTPVKFMGIMPGISYIGFNANTGEALPNCNLGQIRFNYTDPYSVHIHSEQVDSEQYIHLSLSGEEA